MERKDTGDRGEQMAQKYLKKKGYKIVETNYRCRYGEIDIVARHKGCLVLVEVRTKSDPRFGTPEDSITREKALHMERTAEYYRQSHPQKSDNWRIDLIAIEIDDSTGAHAIRHLESVLEE